MSARVIAITSNQPRAGKTHFTAALARWLARHGHSVEVLHLGALSPARMAASDGAVISRNAAILAEAATVATGARHEDPAALSSLAAVAEYVLVECGGPACEEAVETLHLTGLEGAYRLEGYGKLPAWRGAPIVPETPADVAAMEPFRVGGWPRVGVVTLPYLSNFADFRIIRGAEWITAPAPGKFGVIFLPATSDPLSDQAWLETQGLSGWLTAQKDLGCRLVSVGWNVPGAETIEPSGLCDHTLVSRLLGRRMDPPLPDEETYEQLASWLASWARFPSLVQRLESLVVK